MGQTTRSYSTSLFRNFGPVNIKELTWRHIRKKQSILPAVTNVRQLTSWGLLWISVKTPNGFCYHGRNLRRKCRSNQPNLRRTSDVRRKHTYTVINGLIYLACCLQVVICSILTSSNSIKVERRNLEAISADHTSLPAVARIHKSGSWQILCVRTGNFFLA